MTSHKFRQFCLSYVSLYQNILGVYSYICNIYIYDPFSWFLVTIFTADLNLKNRLHGAVITIIIKILPFLSFWTVLHKLIIYCLYVVYITLFYWLNAPYVLPSLMLKFGSVTFPRDFLLVLIFIYCIHVRKFYFLSWFEH